MSADKKSLLEKIKAFFDAPVAVPPVTPAAMEAKLVKLKDGSDISIMQAGDVPAVNDTVTIDGLPALDAEYELETGHKITTVGGIITAVVEPEPVTPTPEEMAAAQAAAAAANPPAPVVLTAEAVQAMYAKFATGTPEERIANLEIMVKALMESNFGYQIREKQADSAIQVYKDTIAAATAPIATMQPQLATALAKLEKQDEVIKMQFELLEKIVETPTADPKTLTGNKKDRFEKLETREAKFKKMADDLKNAKNKNTNPAAQPA